MILIIDNGMHFEDHHIAFVEQGEWDVQEILTLYKWCSWGQPYVIARGENLVWERGSPWPVEVFLKDAWFSLERMPDITTLSDRALRFVIAQQKEEVKEVTAKIEKELNERALLAHIRSQTP